MGSDAVGGVERPIPSTLARKDSGLDTQQCTSSGAMRWTACIRAGCVQQRYVLTVMGFLAVANAYTMRICLSVAITEMVFPTYKTDHNGSHPSSGSDSLRCHADETNSDIHDHSIAEFLWSEATQGLILSSFYWGYVLTHLPGGMLAEKFGGKHTLGLGILCTAIFTLLTPVATRHGGANWLIAVRFAEGLGEGSTFPALNTLLARWIPPSERGILGTFVFSGSLIGTIVGTGLSGLLLQATRSWDSVFYLFGIAAILWCILWQILCYSSPETHPFISNEEKLYLGEAVKGLEKSKDLPPVPLKEMSRSLPLWGLVFAAIGHDWGFFAMVTDLPKYMKNVLKFSISQNGLLSSLPYVAMWLVSLCTGWIADKIIAKKILTTTNTRKLLTTIASAGPAVGIVAASYAKCDRTAVVILFTCAMALMGTFYAGMKVNGLDLSPNYAGSVMAIVNGIGALTGIIVPYIVGILTPDSTVMQWRTVFWITAGVLLFTNVIYVLTASGEVQPWNDCKNETKDTSDLHKVQETQLNDGIYKASVNNQECTIKCVQ